MGVCSSKCIVEAAVTKELKESLKRFCRRNGTSVSGEIRRMIEERVSAPGRSTYGWDDNFIQSVYGGKR
jgi:hypothetical protein